MLDPTRTGLYGVEMPVLGVNLHGDQYKSILLRGLAVLCSLTAELLGMLVAVLPLEEAQKASKAKHAGKHGSTPSPAFAAAAAAAARVAGTESSLSKEMLRLGESFSSFSDIKQKCTGHPTCSM